MSTRGHTTPLLALLLLLAGCGSCQQATESPAPGGVDVGRPPLHVPTARAAGVGPALPGRIAVPTVPSRAVPAPTAPAAAPEPMAPTEPEEAPLAETGAEGDCVVIIDADPDFGEPPLAVNFSVEAQCNGTPSYTWDFGDHSPPASEPAPVHIYEKAGEYMVHLQAVAPDGTQASDEIDITVEESFQP